MCNRYSIVRLISKLTFATAMLLLASQAWSGLSLLGGGGGGTGETSGGGTFSFGDKSYAAIYCRDIPPGFPFAEGEPPLCYLVCEETGAAGTVPCAEGNLPSITENDVFEFKNGKQATITSTSGIDLAATFPAPPLTIQILGTNSNDSVVTISDISGSVMTVGGGTKLKNEQIEATLALADVTLTVSGDEDPATPAKFAVMKYNDDGTIENSAIDGNPQGGRCEGNLTFKVVRECEQDGANAILPCTFRGNYHVAGNSQQGYYSCDSAQNNFDPCYDSVSDDGSYLDCGQVLADPLKYNGGVEKKDFPDLGEGDLRAGDFMLTEVYPDIGPTFFKTRGVNTELAPVGMLPELELDYLASGSAIPLTLVESTVNPNPFNVDGNNNVVSLNVDNQDMTDITGVDPTTAVLVFRGDGEKQVVVAKDHDYNPNSAVFKFYADEVFSAACQILGESAVSDNSVIALPFEAEFYDGGGIASFPTVTIHGNYICQ